jgi:hypothetical protein
VCAQEAAQQQQPLLVTATATASARAAVAAPPPAIITSKSALPCWRRGIAARVGDICFARYALDGRLYKARVLALLTPAATATSSLSASASAATTAPSPLQLMVHVRFDGYGNEARVPSYDVVTVIQQ